MVITCPKCREPTFEGRIAAFWIFFPEHRHGGLALQSV